MFPLSAENRARNVSTFSGENFLKSGCLWINLTAAGDQDTVRSPRSGFQRVWHPDG